MKTPTAEQLKQLEEIAQKIGCSVQDLLVKNEDPAVIIESYSQNNFKILSE
jgi:hypothetical protein